MFDPGDAEDWADGRDGELTCFRVRRRYSVEAGTSREPGRPLASTTLGLLLLPEGKLVRFRDPKTGQDLPFEWEVDEAAEKAEAARRKAEAAERKAEAALEAERQARLRLEARLQGSGDSPSPANGAGDRS